MVQSAGTSAVGFNKRVEVSARQGGLGPSIGQMAGIIGIHCHTAVISEQPPGFENVYDRFDSTSLKIVHI